MSPGNTRLDRLISAQTGIPRRDVRGILARGRVLVDGRPATDINQVVGKFSRVTLDERVLRDSHPIYVMLNKPTGVLSATRDDRHPCVIDLLDRQDRGDLHLAGRLDFNSSGLLLLTNDGRWSRGLSAPEQHVTKWYRVRLEKPLTPDYITAFAQGMYFAYEDITTQPAELRVIEDHIAEVGLIEGRYHQIKRMFGRLDNSVRALHRFAIGNLPLDPTLAPGQSRELTEWEARNIRA